MSESPYVFAATQDNFDSAVLDRSRTLPVLVDFWADWCQPCKILMPLLDRLVDEYRGRFLLAKVDTEEQQELAMAFGIRSIPTVKLFKDGVPVDEFLGVLPEDQIRAFLETHLPRTSDPLAEEAARCIEEGDLEQAGEILDKARALDPENPRLGLVSARLHAALGDMEAAQRELDALPPEEQEQAAGLRARLMFYRAVEDSPGVAALEQSLNVDPGDSGALYTLAGHRVLAGDYEAALELLFALLRQDRAYGDDAARKAMLAVFEILGSGDALVGRYRNRMFNALH